MSYCCQKCHRSENILRALGELKSVQGYMQCGICRGDLEAESVVIKQIQIDQEKDRRLRSFSVKIITAGEYKSRNNIVFEKDVLEKAYKEYFEKTKHKFGQIGLPDADKHFTMIHDAAFEVHDIHTDSEETIMDGMILNTPKGEVLKQMMDDMGVEKTEARCDGYAVIKDNVVKEFHIRSVGMFPKGGDQYVERII